MTLNATPTTTAFSWITESRRCGRDMCECEHSDSTKKISIFYHYEAALTLATCKFSFIWSFIGLFPSTPLRWHNFHPLVRFDALLLSKISCIPVVFDCNQWSTAMSMETPKSDCFQICCCCIAYYHLSSAAAHVGEATRHRRGISLAKILCSPATGNKRINSSFVKPFVKNYTPQILIIQYYTNKWRLEMHVCVCTVRSTYDRMVGLMLSTQRHK